MKHVILLADNDDDLRETYKELLENQGYEVVEASTPEDAQEKLRLSTIDLAIIDIRLRDDDDPRDESGFDLVLEETYPLLPTILLTGYPQQNVSKMDKSLSLGGNKMPPAHAFVKKGDPNELLTRVKELLVSWPRLRTLTLKVTKQLTDDQRNARRQAQLFFRLSVAAIIIGTSLVLIGLAVALFSNSIEAYIGLVVAISGVVVDVVSALFFTRVDMANKRMDIYHRELLQNFWMESLLAQAESLPSEIERPTKQSILLQAANNWFGCPQVE